MSGSNAWTLLGPDCLLDSQMHQSSKSNGPPISGRATAIEIAGSRVFVGTAGGGLWSSSDLGVTWRPLTDALPCASIGALAFDADRNELWVGSGEGNRAARATYGQGLFRLDVSTLNGSSPTFTRFTNFPPQNANFFRRLTTTQLLLEPNGANPAIVWWGTNNGLFCSDDGGANWTKAGFEHMATYQVSSMCFCQTDTGDRMLVALWADGLFERDALSTALSVPTTFTRFTTNPGALPAAAPIGGRIGLAAAPSNPKRVYCALGAQDGDHWTGLFRSDHGGENWVALGLPTPTKAGYPLAQSNYNLALTVDPTNPDIVMFGETGLWRSNNAGKSWSDVTSVEPGTHSDQHAVVFDSAHPQRVWFANDGGVWLSTDGGNTLVARNRGLATLQYYSIAHHPTAASVLIAGAQDNGTQRYVGHPAWTEISGGDGFYCAIDPNEPRYWYSSYPYRENGEITAIKRSDDAGQSWNQIVDGIDPSEFTVRFQPFYCPFVVDPHNAGTLYLGTTRLWRSTDRGDSWLAVRDSKGVFSTATPPAPSSSDCIKSLCVDPNDPKVICFGTGDGRLYRAHIDHVAANRQATATFVQARFTGTGSPAGDYIADVAIPELPAGDPSPAPVYAAFGSDYLTSAVGPANQMSAGRVWKYDFTPGATPDWTALGSSQLDVAFPLGPDLPHTHNFANALVFDPNDPQRLFVGCHVGVFESTDGGSSWSRFSTDLPCSPVADLQLHPTRRLLRAATMGRSIWECPIDPVPGPLTNADIYIRDNVLDVGRFATDANALDPVHPGPAMWFDTADVKTDVDGLFGGFDTLKSTVDYQSNGPIDYIGYQQLSHHALQRGVESRAYLQVINRGPDLAINVRARMYWTRELSDSTFGPLPPDFWTAFPDGVLNAGSQYTPLAPSQIVTTIAAGHPHVFRFDFTAPSVSENVGLLAVITSDNDPITASGTDVQQVVRANKHVVLRRVVLNASTGHIALGVMLVLGVAATATYVATR